MSGTISQIDIKSYNLLLESIRDHAVIILDTEGYIVNWSKGAEDIKGYTEDEVLGKHFSIFYSEDEIKRGEPGKNLQKTKEEGRLEFIGWRVRKD